MDAVSEPVCSLSSVVHGESLTSMDAEGNSVTDAFATSNDVLSRISMSDEQREIKRRFEEKQRDEARRSAHAERAAKKKASSDSHSVS